MRTLRELLRDRAHFDRWLLGESAHSLIRLATAFEKEDRFGHIWAYILQEDLA